MKGREGKPIQSDHHPLSTVLSCVPKQQEIIMADDPLDSSDFDPVEFINQSFPDEASLDDLDTFVVGIGSQISTLDEEISRAVQAQSSAGQQASKVKSVC